jgi:dTDP-D-glucose 4,6-dehydratase
MIRNGVKLLVAGGAGFIGSNFIRYMLGSHEDWRIVNVDKLTYAGNLANLKDLEGDDRYAFVRADICDGARVGEIVAAERPDAIVNFAAETHVDRSIDDPALFLRTNVLGTQVLLEEARRQVSRVTCRSPPTRFTARSARGVSSPRSRRFAPIPPMRPARRRVTSWRVPGSRRMEYRP